jgi:hypothetical protein
LSIDIADLNPEIDITVAGPEDYQDNVAPPLPIGTYSLRLKDFTFEPAKTAGKPPCLVLKTLEVADGPLEGRNVGGWQRVYATQFDRKDPVTGQTTKASGLGDLIRSIDKSFDTSRMTLPEVQQFLQRAVDERATFKAKLDWEGFDSDYNTQLRDERGVAKNDYKSAQAKEIDALVKFRGKAFGGKPSLVSPHSGNKVEAKVRLSNFYPSRD